jgi:hypothetical protein
MASIDDLNLLTGPLILWVFGQAIPYLAWKSIDVWESQDYAHGVVNLTYVALYGVMGYLCAETHEKVKFSC